VFDEVLKKETGRRATRRGFWLLGSTVVQAGLVVAVVMLAGALAAQKARERVVEVKFVKGAPRVVSLPPPAALPRPMRPLPARARPKEPPKPVPAMIQPRVVAAEIKPPDPAEPPEPEPQEEGVVGGMVGEVSRAVVAPVPEPPVRPEFNAATMTRPVFVSGPEPSYTQRALEQEVAGLMVVQCVLTAEGTVRDCRVLKGLPHMDSAVVDALEHRRYKPATQNGKPVEISYVFKLNLEVPR
jgi:periplasmic protein TonB